MTAESGYSLRTYAPGDEVAIQRAFAEVFGPGRALEEWHWKFLSPPRGSRIVLAFDTAGELVCQYAAITVDVAWSGLPMRAAQIVDVFSRRRRALGPRGSPFLRTLEAFLEACAAPDGVGFVYGFPSERHQRAGAIAGRYFEPATLERLSRAAVIPAPAARSASGSRWAPARSWICEGFDAHATDRLWLRSRGRYPFATVRDAAWFHWRYERRPGIRYVHLSVRRAGETRAWGVLALPGGIGACTGGTAHWADLLWDGENPSDLVDLAAALAQRAAALDAQTLALWLRGDPKARAILLDHGFSSAPEPLLRLSAIAFDAQVSVPQVLESFYLTMGDSDHF
jgi:hypothetical protein